MPRTEEAETRRILGRYKRLVLLGKARVPLDAGRRLVGPDTAFHLYFRHAEAPPAPARRRSGRRKAKRPPTGG